MEVGSVTESRVSSVWDHPLIVTRIASFLSPSFVNLRLRLVSTDLSQQLDQYDLLDVAKGMSGEDCIAALAAARSELTLWQRQRILGAAAVYGDADTLERVAEAAGCAPVDGTMAAAARAGQLACCQRLVEMGCPEGEGLKAAASGGQREMCEWFLGRGAVPSFGPAVAAATSGHVELVDMLFPSWPHQSHENQILNAVAHGCDKEMLQRMCSKMLRLPAEAGSRDAWQLLSLRAPAAGSPTLDWQDKLTWLEVTGSGRPDSAAVCEAAARCPGAEAVARLQWLQQRGHPVTQGQDPNGACFGGYFFTRNGPICVAAASGNVEAFSWLREQGAPLPGRPVTVKLEGDANAARSLRDVLPGLMEAGCPVDYFSTALHAAQRSDRKGVTWLVERFPAQPPPGVAPADYPRLLQQAAASGSVQLMAWVKGWGAELTYHLWKGAVMTGCEAALLWLRDNGCPAPDESCYATALLGDPCTLRALLKLKLRDLTKVSITLWIQAHERQGTDSSLLLPNMKLLLKHGFLAEGHWDEARVLVASLPSREARKALFEWLRQERAQGA